MPVTPAVPMAPFTFVGPVQREDHFEIRIMELPDFYLAAETRDELFREIGPAVNEFLESYKDRGQPLPAGNLDRWIAVSPTLPDAVGIPTFEASQELPGRTGNLMAGSIARVA